MAKCDLIQYVSARSRTCKQEVAAWPNDANRTGRSYLFGIPIANISSIAYRKGAWDNVLDVAPVEMPLKSKGKEGVK